MKKKFPVLLLAAFVMGLITACTPHPQATIYSEGQYKAVTDSVEQLQKSIHAVRDTLTDTRQLLTSSSAEVKSLKKINFEQARTIKKLTDSMNNFRVEYDEKGHKILHY